MYVCATFFLNNEVVQVLKGQKLHVATSEVDPNVIEYVSFMMCRSDWMVSHHVILRQLLVERGCELCICDCNIRRLESGNDYY